MMIPRTGGRTGALCLIGWCVLLAAVAGCRGGDLDAGWAALERTDREWAAVTAAGEDLDRIVSYWTDDARVYPAGMPVVEGKAAIREFVAESLRTPGFAVTWAPSQVVVSADGRMGYTTGTNRFTMPDEGGRLVTTTGRYVTVWRKEPDGAWRCAIDIWNAAPERGGQP